MCACLAVSVFPGLSILLSRLASRVTLAVRADARHVLYLTFYVCSPSGLCATLAAMAIARHVISIYLIYLTHDGGFKGAI